MKKRIFALTLALLLLALPLFTACDDEEATPPVFTPPPFEETAQAGEPEVPEGLGWKDFDAQGEYRFAACGVIQVQDKKADVYFTNFEENTVWLKLRVLDEQGNILGQTGLIKPGEYIKSVSFDKVPQKGAKIVLKCMGYMPDTYQSAGEVDLNTMVS